MHHGKPDCRVGRARWSARISHTRCSEMTLAAFLSMQSDDVLIFSFANSILKVRNSKCVAEKLSVPHFGGGRWWGEVKKWISFWFFVFWLHLIDWIFIILLWYQYIFLLFEQDKMHWPIILQLSVLQGRWRRAWLPLIKDSTWFT